MRRGGGAGAWSLAVHALGVGAAVAGADAVARRNRRRMVPLAGAATTAATIDVIVPARDEAAVIGACVTALRAGEPGARVIVVDDASTDGTGDLAEHAGARVVRLDSAPPRGWTGKTHAIVTGHEAAAAQAHPAEWLAFVDADVELAPGALTALVTHAREHRLDAVSPLLRQRCGSMVERLLVPLAFWQWSVGMGDPTGGPAAPGRAMLNGQCLLVRRDAYEACGGHGHASVRATPVEDAALARRLARCGGRTALVGGDSLGSVRMYASAAAVRRGFLKNAGELVASDWRRGSAVALTGAVLAQAPQLLLAAARRRDRAALVAIAAAWLVPAAVLAPRYATADGVPAVTALAVPLAAVALQLIAVESLVRLAVRRPATWKGRRPPGHREGR